MQSVVESGFLNVPGNNRFSFIMMVCNYINAAVVNKFDVEEFCFVKNGN